MVERDSVPSHLVGLMMILRTVEESLRELPGLIAISATIGCAYTRHLLVVAVASAERFL